PTLEEMSRRHADGEMFRGYAVAENGQVIVALLDAPRLIGRDSLLEITLDDGSVIKATPDHGFMRRTGEWAEAADLRAGDSLMPLYRSSHRGYEMTYQPLTGYYYPTQRMADEWNLRHEIYSDQLETHGHHVDHDEELLQKHRGRRTESEREAQRERQFGFWKDNPPARRAQGQLSRAAWQRAPRSRRHAQAEHARQLRLREDIDAVMVRKALDETGSIRGAADQLAC